jgi:hypothetical protein
MSSGVWAFAGVILVAPAATALASTAAATLSPRIIIAGCKMGCSCPHTVNRPATTSADPIHQAVQGFDDNDWFMICRRFFLNNTLI